MSICTCFDRALGKISEQLKTQLPEKEAAGLKADWENKALVMSENSMEMKIGIPVSYEYQKFKMSGEPHKRTTKDTVNIMMSYCPFCGKEMRTKSLETVSS